MSFEEQQAKIRRIRYTAGSVVTLLGPALATALLYGGVDKWLALALAVSSLVGGSATNALAANKTGQQINDGHFAPPPAPPAEETAIGALKEILQHAADAQATVSRVTDGITDALGVIVAPNIPAAVGAAEDVVGDFLHRVTGHR